jgi:arylsulfatase A-like enzyme
LFYQRLEDHVPTLADRLSARGYQTAAVVSNVVLTAEALGLDERFDHYDDFVDERESARKIYERSAARTTNAAIEWLRAHHDPARPHLLWVHYIDPHGPYRPPADKPTDFTHRDDVVVDPSRIPGYQRIPERMTDGLEYVDRYDEEIAYLDRELGRLLETYEKLGLADDAVIVLTADHGETMIEHEKLFSHGFHVWDAIMRVPLVIRRPDRVGRRVAEPVSLVDLVPTLLAYAGLDPPKDVDGHVLDQRPANAPVSLEATRTQRLGQMRAAVIGEHKWFAQVGPNGRIVRRWYADLNTDGDVETQHPWPGDLPGGTLLESWVSEDPDPAGIPRRYEKGLQLRAPKVAPGRSEREIEALRALGYVE